MNENIKKSIGIAKEKYCNYLSSKVPDFWTNYRYNLMVEHIELFSQIISENFDFEEINLIETGVSSKIEYGLWGFFLAALVEDYGGKMSSVDIDCESCNKSLELFNQEFPNLKYETFCQDSVDFLKTPSLIPNLVSLDSFNFQLFNPLPSALHAYKEFITIEKLMPKGGIIFIDDNWMHNTELEWYQNGIEYHVKIDYPILGKGANVYDEVLSNRTNFDLIGNHYTEHKMIKIYFKKT